jgi:UTP--glucose-1-phosphate uridylyltransferase
MAGARKLVFVTGASKRAIEDHFDTDADLEKLLEEQGKSELASLLRVLPKYASCIYIRQPAPLGLGHAVLCAQPVVGNEPFFVHLADDLIDGGVPCLKQMATAYAQKGGSVLGVEEVPPTDTDKYGIVETRGAPAKISRIHGIVEKPKPEATPSRLAVSARYVLSPSIFAHLEKTPKGKGGELQLTDAMASLMKEEALHGLRYDGQRHDIGNKLDFIKANLHFGLQRADIGPALQEYVQQLAR